MDLSVNADILIDILPEPIRGLEAAKLQIISQGRKPGDTFFAKENNNIPYLCIVNSDYSFTIYEIDYRRNADGSPAKNENDNKIWFKTEKVKENGFGFLSSRAAKGSEIFILPNLQKGLQQCDTLGTNVIFAEIDDRPLDEQWQKIYLFYLSTGLIPALIIFSGGKSLHVYYRLSSTVTDVSVIKELEHKIIVAFRSDVLIENTNREMRFAGFNRLIKGTHQEIQFINPAEYSEEEFRARLDKYVHEGQSEDYSLVTGYPQGMTPLRFSEYKKVFKSEDANVKVQQLLLKTEEDLKPKPKERIARPPLMTGVGGEVPLEVFLSIEERALVEKGLAEGGRNYAGLCLAAKLIGRELKLTELGIPHTDTARQLFDDFCYNCSPSVDDREAGKMWENAHKNVVTYLPNEFFEKRWKWWLWENDKETWEKVCKETKTNNRVIPDPKPKTIPEVSTAIVPVINGSPQLPPAKEEPKNNIVSYRVKGWDNWIEAIKYRPNIRFNSRYFSFDYSMIMLNAVVGVKAALGNGKTKWVIGLMKHLGLKSLIITHRNSLCYEISERIRKEIGYSIYHGNDESGFSLHQINTDEGSGIVTCIDSLLKMNISEVRGRVIIIDEAESLVTHELDSSTLKKKREEVIKHLQQCVEVAALVVLLDGNLTDPTVDYFHNLDSSKNVQKLLNDWKPEPMKIFHLAGSITEDIIDCFSEEQIVNFALHKEIEVKLKDNSPLIKQILEQQISDCENFAVASDSKMQLHTMHQFYQSKGLKSMIVTSESLDQNWLLVPNDLESSVRDFMKNPDAFLNKYKPQCLLYSPTIESGTDISVDNFFKKMYGLFFGVLGAFSIVQMLGRLRDSEIIRYLWVNPHVLGQSYDYTSCKAESLSDLLVKKVKFYSDQLRDEAIAKEVYKPDHQSIHIEASRLALEAIASEKIHLDIYSEIQARLRFEKANPRLTVLHLLKESGHQITDIVLKEEKDSKDQLKEVKDQIVTYKSCETAKAEVYTPEVAEKIKAKLVKTPQESFNLQMSYIDSRLPGIKKLDYWERCGADFCRQVLFDDRQWINHQENYWKFMNIDIMNKEEADGWVYKIERAFQKGNHHRFPGDVNSTYSKLLLLKEWDFDFFLNKENAWHSGSPEVTTFIEKFNTQHEIFGREYPVGIPPKWVKKDSKLTPEQIAERAKVKLLRELMQFVGCDTVATKRVKCDDDKIRTTFSLDMELFSEVSRAIAQDLLEKKHLDWKEGKREVKEFCAVKLGGTAAERLLNSEWEIDESIFDWMPGDEIPVSKFEVGSVVECEVDDAIAAGIVTNQHFCQEQGDWLYDVDFAEGDALIYEESMTAFVEGVDVLTQVDSRIKQAKPSWSDRLMKAMAMGAETAKKLYQEYYSEPVTNALGMLAEKVQSFYCELFEGTQQAIT